MNYFTIKILNAPLGTWYEGMEGKTFKAFLHEHGKYYNICSNGHCVDVSDAEIVEMPLYPNATHLLEHTPDYGWGDESVFEDNQKSWAEVWRILQADAEMSIVFSRANYLRKSEKEGKEPEPFKKWFKGFMAEDSWTVFLSKEEKIFMDKNDDNTFTSFDMSNEYLEYLAGKFIQYHQ